MKRGCCSESITSPANEAMENIRVLIVEDSLTVRAYLADVLSRDAEIEVVGLAEDGKRAIDLCRQLLPTVITLDIVLPALSGLAVTEYVMAYCPTPILIVSSSANRGDLFKTYDALAAGAVDVLEKPCGDEFGDQWERRFVSAVKLVSRIKVVTHPRLKLGAYGRTFAPAPPTARCQSHEQAPRLLVMGASTGGPAAILAILRALGPDFPLPILLVLHIGEMFATAFAEWLDVQSSMRVRYAKDGESLPCRGDTQVIVAPPGRHLIVREGRLWLTSDYERHSCRPSVDVLFESVAQDLGGQAIACLLTGMGRDGAQGLLAIQRAGGTTLAQDEASSVVFGMPREAILLGAADRVLPLGEIAPALMALAGSTPPEKWSP